MEKDTEDQIIDTIPDTSIPGKESTPEEGPVDQWGRGFDPSVHVTDSKGDPVITAKGRLRVQRGKGIKPSTVAGVSKDLAFTQTGAATAEIIFIVSMALGGQDWQPSIDERAYMSSAWAEYFKAKGIKDLPPGYILATALISYAAPRFTKPETKNRLRGAFTWLKRRFKRDKPEVQEYQQPDMEV